MVLHDHHLYIAETLHLLENFNTVDPESVNVGQTLSLESHSVQSGLSHNVEKLWQADVLLFQSSKSIVTSKKHLKALAQLRFRTVCVAVAGFSRYGTPLLQIGMTPVMPAPKTQVTASLCRTKRRLVLNPK